MSNIFFIFFLGTSVGGGVPKNSAAYTLDKENNGNVNESFDESDLLVDIYSLNNKDTDSVRDMLSENGKKVKELISSKMEVVRRNIGLY